MPADQNYVKTAWVNDSAPDIDATNLNKLEQGVFDAHDRLNKFFGRGLDSAKPTAASVGTEALYWATDTELLYESDGAVWDVLRPTQLDYFVRYFCNFGAAPDTSYRFCTNGVLASDEHALTQNAVTTLFRVPTAGRYHVTVGMELPNTKGGNCGIWLVDNASGQQKIGGRGVVPAGTDADGALLASGFSKGPWPVQLAAGQDLKFGGFYSGPVTNFHVWAMLLRVGVS